MVAGQDVYNTGALGAGTQNLSGMSFSYGARTPQKVSRNPQQLSSVSVVEVTGEYNLRYNDSTYYENWQPSKLTGIAHWYRADLGVLNASSNPATDSEDVNTWQDQVGTAHLVANASTSRPALTAEDSTINDKPSLAFVSTSDPDRMDATIDDIAQPVTWFIIYKHDAAVDALRHFVGTSYDSATKTGQVIYCDSSTKRVAASDSGITNISGPANDNAWTLLVVTFNGSSSRLVVDQTNKGGNPGSNSSKTDLHVGANAYSSEALVSDMTLAEFGVAVGELTDRDINILRTYVKQRYGITTFAEI